MKHRRYQVWHDGTGMQHPMHGYINGYVETMKEIRESFKRHRKSYPKGVMEIHEVDFNGKKIRKTNIKP